MDYRILPLVSFGLCMIAGVLFYLKRKLQSLLIFLFAAGMLSFCYFQATLYLITDDIIFGSLMHELSELWFLIVLTELLRRLFTEKKITVKDKVLLAQ